MTNARGTNDRNNGSSDDADRADVVEQQTELDDTEEREPRPEPDDARSRGEATEADTVEQLREVRSDEEDYR
ncbi:hypothetical protein J4H86_10170 [Spiractinospora alimapuensis]|uniref:hypothetical protein n=1 Tax=Spiractinospora alimapuensis TaxID=2820884 RepID=UPI001F2FA728|nr:hypothetical protein [Spiractinospora alimapuensis]QVQ54027.1 hypothetical protein J4H86_10170 [Spiractinospora alimapuensis]